MRLWHKDLISFLPRQQLLGQWRECCAIAKSLKNVGTPNHILVNRILEYPTEHFYTYGKLIVDEMTRRGYHVNGKVWKYFVRDLMIFNEKSLGGNAAEERKGNEGWIVHYFDEFPVSYANLFSHWHNERYFAQCIANLEEKFDCGGIPVDDWNNIYHYFFGRGDS